MRGEVEQLTARSAEMDSVRDELKNKEQQNHELHEMVATKNKSIQDLEDSISVSSVFARFLEVFLLLLGKG